jgi:Sulfate permease family
MPDSPGARWRGWLRALPVLQGVLPVERSRVPADALAGLTLAALGIPEVLGYAKIAGMPVVTGLYTMLLPMAVFAVLGSSRHLVVAADSATAVILATALSCCETHAAWPAALSPKRRYPGRLPEFLKHIEHGRRLRFRIGRVLRQHLRRRQSFNAVTIN